METYLMQALSSAGGGMIVGFLVLILYKKQSEREAEEYKKICSKVQTLSERLNDLEDNRFSKLERLVERHIALDQGQRILTQLELLSVNLGKMERNIEKLLQSDSSQAARLDGHDRYLSNIDNMMQRTIFLKNKGEKNG